MRAAGRAAALAWGAAPWHVLAGLLLALVEAAVPTALVWLTKLTLDALVARAPLENVVWPVAGLAASGLVAAITPQAGQYVRTELGRRVARRAKNELFTAVERFSGLARYEDPALLDRLRLAQQSADTPGYLLDMLLQLGRGAMVLAGLAVSLAILAPGLAVALLAASVPAFLVELRLSRGRAEMLWKVSPAERREQFYAMLMVGADAAKEIRLLGLGPFLRGRMNREVLAADRAKQRVDRREAWAQALVQTLAALVTAAGLAWAVLEAARGRLSVGDVSLVAAAAAGVQGALTGLVAAVAGAHQQLAMFLHFHEVMGLEGDLPAAPRPRALLPLRAGIELRDVWFRYSDEHPWVLRGVNLLLPAGAAVGLVGHNGSGKSTLVKLLCRFYDPQRGQILWDGMDIRQTPAEDLRARVSAVFQDFVSYDFSAHDNIAVGDLAAMGRPEPVERAAAAAGVHETLATLPNGYATLLTRSFYTAADEDDPQVGVLLSGGQWQRVALARAFLRSDRDLMILDEPSAGLDPEAEHDLHTRLRSARAGRTSLLISHRLSAVREADKIVVLADGVVTESGGHDELVAAGGLYARMFQTQAAGYAEVPG